MKPQNSIKHKTNVPRLFYRRGDVAEALSVHVRTVDRYARNGTLPPPIQLSPGVSGWRTEAIVGFLDKFEAA